MNINNLSRLNFEVCEARVLEASDKIDEINFCLRFWLIWGCQLGSVHALNNFFLCDSLNFLVISKIYKVSV